MLVEVIAAALVGAAALWLALGPIFVPPRPKPPVFEPLDPEETASGVALTALKEIEFDRETGKLSDADYGLLKRQYTAAALQALRAESEKGASADVEAMIAIRVKALRSASATAPTGAPACHACGPRPELDAVFCSGCGERLASGTACARCGSALAPESRFCEGCGSRVAA
jgi:rRNA maturation endonuclease Nob1